MVAWKRTGNMDDVAAPRHARGVHGGWGRGTQSSAADQRRRGLAHDAAHGALHGPATPGPPSTPAALGTAQRRSSTDKSAGDQDTPWGSCLRTLHTPMMFERMRQKQVHCTHFVGPELCPCASLSPLTCMQGSALGRRRPNDAAGPPHFAHGHAHVPHGALEVLQARERLRHLRTPGGSPRQYTRMFPTF